jgi:hypothetical protein
MKATTMPCTAIHQPEFLEGQLKGTQLKQVIPVPQFWFAWSQFHQGIRVFTTR